MKDHTKFKGVMATRINHLKPVIHWWNSGNIKSAMNAISMYTLYICFQLKYSNIGCILLIQQLP